MNPQKRVLSAKQRMVAVFLLILINAVVLFLILKAVLGPVDPLKPFLLASSVGLLAASTSLAYWGVKFSVLSGREAAIIAGIGAAIGNALFGYANGSNMQDIVYSSLIFGVGWGIMNFIALKARASRLL